MDQHGNLVDETAARKGSDALGAAAPHQHCAEGDTSRLEELEQFRRDLSDVVRLYDFLSQIIDFEDAGMEKQAIFFSYPATQIRPEERSENVDLSDVWVTPDARSACSLGNAPMAGRHRFRRGIRRASHPARWP